MKSTYKVFYGYIKDLSGWKDKLYLWDIEAEEAEIKRDTTLLFDTGCKNFDHAKKAVKEWLEGAGRDFSLVSKSWSW